MHTLLLPLVLLALQQAPAAHQARVAWVPNPRTLNGTWVSDAGDHLRPGTRDSVNAAIGALETATGAEIAVVIVDSLAGLTEQEFALAIHRTWGVGKEGADNGVVLLWAPTDRAVFISVGYGLEGAIPDRLAGRIRDQEIFTAFRAGEFDRGILQGVAAMAAVIREEYATGGPARLRARGGDAEADGPGGTVRRLTGSIVGFVAAIIAAIGAVVSSIVGVRRWRRRRPRPCPKCGTRMSLLGEEADDARLDAGQKAEERLKSVNWDVWVCPSCDETLRIPFKARFTTYSECQQCKRRTAQSGRRTQLRAPTTTSTGLAEVRIFCGHCGHAYTTTETIARLSSSSGSSSSGFSGGSSGGGSSFGGGSAGGGGAGGRY